MLHSVNEIIIMETIEDISEIKQINCLEPKNVLVRLHHSSRIYGLFSNISNVLQCA